jgi:hypothetical protein
MDMLDPRRGLRRFNPRTVGMDALDRSLIAGSSVGGVHFGERVLYVLEMKE